MKNSKPLIKAFFQYIAKPVIEVDASPDLRTILFNVVRLWSVIFLVSMFFAMIANFMLAQEGYGDDDFAITRVATELPRLILFLLVVVWAPVSEEFAFRLWLRFSPLNWAVGFGFLFLFLASFFDIPYLHEDLFTFNSGIGILSSASLLLLTGLVIYSLLSVRNVGTNVEKMFRKNFRFIFYFITIFFAFLHLSNYDVDLLSIWYFAPILIAPQFLLSFGISFVRMNYGFFWAVFMHTLNNLVAVTPLLFLAPILFGMENLHFESEEVFEIFSMTEIFTIIFVGMFLLLVFTICILSVFSLTFEYLRKDK